MKTSTPHTDDETRLRPAVSSMSKVRPLPSKDGAATESAVPETIASESDGPLRQDDLPKPLPAKRRSMARVRLVLDEGQTTDVLGICYGLEHEITEPGYSVKILLDYYNKRIKVLSYKARDYRAMVMKLRFLAAANRFDKIWVTASKTDWEQFLRYGYVLEGLLKYANRGQTAYMMSKFRSQKRLHSPDLMQETLLIEEIMDRPRKATPKDLPEGYVLDFAREEDIDGMLALYRRVFKTYPSPLTYREYLVAILHRDAIFRVIRDPAGNVVSVASAELDTNHRSAELTDCATHPDERGKGLMGVILHALEADLKKAGYFCAYTLARARSYGMNAAFHALGYEFNGRMINNCDIYGALEDMNLWVKNLKPQKKRRATTTRSLPTGKKAGKPPAADAVQTSA